MARGDARTTAPRTIRCAIYTRKSTEEGLDQDFNSLDAQREAGEAYVKSQRHEGWAVLADRYDDGGFTGANMERPALRRLLADIEGGKVDAVVVYKVDRLSRSLLDFARLIEVFDRRGVSFVSVTQQFNTGTSLGRLVLNILLSFAQFEREMIAERTRDKMSAARRKGKWTGGMQILGYDVAPGGGKLVVNEAEAEQVREVFRLYIETGSLLATAKALTARGWRTKAWVTKKGVRRPGAPWTKANVRGVVANPTYVGRVAHRGEVYAGEQPAIVDEATFKRAQMLLGEGREHGARGVRNAFGYLLKGLVRCTACGSSMTPVTTKKGTRAYRYYRCVRAQKAGTEACPVRSVPAAELERFVLERLKRLARDPVLVGEVVIASNATADDAMVDGDVVRAALVAFDELWELLETRERTRIVELAIERVDFDGVGGEIGIRFHPLGLKELAEEMAPGATRSSEASNGNVEEAA